MTAPNITEVRQHLMETLVALRNRENPMDLDRARAVAQVASVMVDTAKVEVDYIKATGSDRSGFLEEPVQIGTDASTSGVPGITRITQHRIR